MQMTRCRRARLTLILLCELAAWQIRAQDAFTLGSKESDQGLLRDNVALIRDNPPVAFVFVPTQAPPASTNFGITDYSQYYRTMRTYSVLRDGSFKLENGFFRRQQTYQMSPDRSVLLVNQPKPIMLTAAKPEPSCRVFTPEGCFVASDPGVLSADGRLVWICSETDGTGRIRSYEISTGKPCADLPLLGRQMFWMGIASPEAICGPEFVALAREPLASGGYLLRGWGMAVGDAEFWTMALTETPRMTGPGNVLYVGNQYSHVWRTPSGGLILSDAGRKRTWFVSAERVAELLTAPKLQAGAAVAISSTAAADEQFETWAVGDLPYFRDMPDVSVPQPEWNKAGTKCIWGNRGFDIQWPQTTATYLIDTVGAWKQLPTQLASVHFAADGENLLAVVDARLVDRTAVPSAQVLAELDIDTYEVLWHSRPFARCAGMYPYPAFDLEEFHRPPPL